MVVLDRFRVAVPHYGPAGEVFPICLVKRCLQQRVPSQPYCTLSNGIATYVRVNSGSGDLGHFSLGYMGLHLKQNIWKTTVCTIQRV